MPQSRALRRTYASLDIMAAADVAPDRSEDEDKEPAESEATNQDDDDNDDEEKEEGEGEGMLTTRIVLRPLQKPERNVNRNRGA
jgi:hypothetical protein